MTVGKINQGVPAQYKVGAFQVLPKDLIGIIFDLLREKGSFLTTCKYFSQFKLSYLSRPVQTLVIGNIEQKFKYNSLEINAKFIALFPDSAKFVIRDRATLEVKKEGYLQFSYENCVSTALSDSRFFAAASHHALIGQLEDPTLKRIRDFNGGAFATNPIGHIAYVANDQNIVITEQNKADIRFLPQASGYIPQIILTHQNLFVLQQTGTGNLIQKYDLTGQILGQFPYRIDNSSLSYFTLHKGLLICGNNHKLLILDAESLTVFDTKQLPKAPTKYQSPVKGIFCTNANIYLLFENHPSLFLKARITKDNNSLSIEYEFFREVGKSKSQASTQDVYFSDKMIVIASENNIEFWSFEGGFLGKIENLHKPLKVRVENDELFASFDDGSVKYWPKNHVAKVIQEEPKIELVKEPQLPPVVNEPSTKVEPNLKTNDKPIEKATKSSFFLFRPFILFWKFLKSCFGV
jgi:hypothetical protein